MMPDTIARQIMIKAGLSGRPRGAAVRGAPQPADAGAMHRRFGGGTERGIALLVVLWTLTLLSALAAAFASSARTETRLARNAVENAQARALAEAGVSLAIAALLEPGAEELWRIRGYSLVFALGEGLVRISVEDEGGKVDLNVAPDLLLESLLLSAGADPVQSKALVDAVGDWRDSDDLRRPNGAEADDYRRAGLPYGPKNAPFDAIEELQRVVGITPALYQRLAPAITVYSRRQTINPRTALPAVLMAVPGLDIGDVQAILNARMAGVGPEQPLASNRFFHSSSLRVATIRAEARPTGNVVFVQEAVVALTQDPAQPFRIYDWKQGRLR